MSQFQGQSGVEVLERKTVFQGYFRMESYTLRHALFGGGWSRALTREVFERGHAAGLMAYDPDRREFVMCEQFRVGALAAGTEAWQLEIVAGIIEEGEEPEDVARREAMEEIGLTVSDIIPIQRYLVSPGGTSESIYLFLGRVSSAQAGEIYGAEEEDEHIRVKILRENELKELMSRGEITNAMTLIAAQWFFLNKDKIRTAWNVKE